MDQDKPEMADGQPDGAGRRREPPTIELKPSEFAAETGENAAGSSAEPDAGKPDHNSDHEDAGRSTDDGAQAAAAERAKRPAGHPALAGALSGALAGAVLLAGAWAVGWPPQKVQEIPAVSPAVPAVDAKTVDALAGRLAKLEDQIKSVLARPQPAADPAIADAAKRIDGVERTLGALRGDVAAQQTRADRLAGEIAALRAVPREAAPTAAAQPAPMPDLSGIEGRIANVEQALRAVEARPQVAPAPAIDLAPLRRAVAAAMLADAVRQGEPFAALLTDARKLGADSATLAPLEPFAQSGLPSADQLGDDLLAVLPKLRGAPAKDGAPATAPEAGLLDRLQASAARLVHIRRKDGAGSSAPADAGALARISAAAKRGDIAAARRELLALPEAERTAAQGWIATANAREAALNAIQKFGNDAMAGLTAAER